jgi:uncharacterized protein (TIGR03083 family)
MTDRKADAWRLVREERQDLLAFFRSLTAEEWEAPSLCAGWRIRDVAAHLLVDEPVQAGALRRVLPMLVRGGFTVDSVNAWWVEQNRRTAVESILARFVDDSQRGIGLFGRVLGPGVALRALVVHHQDMRRPLHRDRSIPDERLLATLHALLTWKGTLSVGSRARARRLRLRAVDVGWSHGVGPEVCGPAEAIIVSLAGRREALTELEGEGKDILAARCLDAAHR